MKKDWEILAWSSLIS